VFVVHFLFKYTKFVSKKAVLSYLKLSDFIMIKMEQTK
jgi:hypothetical protein